MQNTRDPQESIVVVAGARTPFVRARTVFKKMPASMLGGVALRETVARAAIDPALIPTLIEEVYFGIVSAPAEGTNVSREALFDSGLPSSIPCTTINRYCASSAESVAGIMAKIVSGQIQTGIAGGVESISSVRALFSQKATDYFQDLAKAKTVGQRLALLSKFKPALLAPHAPGINEPTTGLSMGQSADLMARVFGVGREEQDRYAVESHHKAAAAWESGFYKTHVAAVATPDSKVIDRDTDVRGDTSVEKIAGLRPAFYKDGTITAGNASPLTDGASAVMLMKESRARELGLKPLGRIRGYAAAGVDIKKEPLLIGPVYAIPRALASAGVQWSDIDLLEVHEAFAAQVLSTVRAIESASFAREKLGLSKAIGSVDPSRLNIHGGSIPLGHPFGATGTRMVLQTLHGLRARNKSLGLISICAAGGLGSVMVVEAM
ncbi:MAG: acetyl-CoA C-acyltransferase [Oligoflexia bacterium]